MEQLLGIKVIFRARIAKFLGLSTLCFALSINSVLAQLSTYEVKPGDSLIGVAAKFVADESLWPTVWDQNYNLNEKGENTFALFPGDIVSYQEIDGQPKLMVEHSKEIKLTPQVEVSALSEAIPTIALDTIKPFLVQTRYLTQEELDKAPRISETAEGSLGSMPGDIVYVEGILGNKFSGYTIYKTRKEIIHPYTKEALGLEAIAMGRAKLDISSQQSVMVIEKATQEIEPGDLILPLESASFKPYYLPKVPTGYPHGYIVGLLADNEEISQYNVVTISGGKDKERMEGDILDIYRTPKKERLNLKEGESPFLPSRRIGRMMVFRVYDKLSLGLILSAKAEIALNDEVAKP